MKLLLTSSYTIWVPTYFVKQNVANSNITIMISVNLLSKACLHYKSTCGDFKDDTSIISFFLLLNASILNPLSLTHIDQVPRVSKYYRDHEQVIHTYTIDIL